MEPWDHIETWETPIRTEASECIELAMRLHRRHAERWRRLLTRCEHEIKGYETWLSTHAG
jgi:hypothetical protein